MGAALGATRYAASLLVIDRILKLMVKKDYTVGALATKIHKSEWMTQRYLKLLEDEGRVHLANWIPMKVGTKTLRRASYRLGPGERAKRPSIQEVKRDKYAENRKNPDFLPRHAAKERIRVFKAKPDQAAAWLF